MKKRNDQETSKVKCVTEEGKRLHLYTTYTRRRPTTLYLPNITRLLSVGGSPSTAQHSTAEAYSCLRWEDCPLFLRLPGWWPSQVLSAPLSTVYLSIHPSVCLSVPKLCGFGLSRLSRANVRSASH